VAEKSDVSWQGRQHFFFAAARAMRDLLVEQARRRSRQKHGGGKQREGRLDAVAPPLPVTEGQPERFCEASLTGEGVYSSTICPSSTTRLGGR
jgi:hypothetical protein